MRVGLYEILLMRENGEVFKEETINGNTFAVAESGAEYHVEVRVYCDRLGRFPADFLRFGLYVDGVDVQYWKRLDLSKQHGTFSPQPLKFWGFKKNVNELRSFVFARPAVAPSSSSSSSSAATNKPLGIVKLVIFEARIVGGVFNNLVGVHDIPLTHQVGDNEKVAKQASVATVAGGIVDAGKEKFIPNLNRWENVSTTPLATLELKYHTELALKLLRNGQSEQRVKRPLALAAVEEDATKKARNHTDDGEEIGFEILQREKKLPILDLTEDNPEWRTTVVRKS
eukprot:gene32139-38875_t